MHEAIRSFDLRTLQNAFDGTTTQLRSVASIADRTSEYVPPPECRDGLLRLASRLRMVQGSVLLRGWTAYAPPRSFLEMLGRVAADRPTGSGLRHQHPTLAKIASRVQKYIGRGLAVSNLPDLLLAFMLGSSPTSVWAGPIPQQLMEPLCRCSRSAVADTPVYVVVRESLTDDSRRRLALVVQRARDADRLVAMVPATATPWAWAMQVYKAEAARNRALCHGYNSCSRPGL